MGYKFIKTVVMLIAVFATSAIAVSSASAALPEFLAGKFPDTFTAKGGTVHIDTVGGDAYTCDTSSMTGEITGSKELAKVHVTFGSCSSYLACLKETSELRGRIGYVSKSKEVGLLLEPVTQPFAKCGLAVVYKIEGSVIGSIRPVNIATKEFDLGYSQGAQGIQDLRKFEGEEPTHNLEVSVNGGAYEGLSLGTTMTLVTEYQTEIA